jgi:hypothetical protein
MHTTAPLSDDEIRALAATSGFSLEEGRIYTTDPYGVGMVDCEVIELARAIERTLLARQGKITEPTRSPE